MRHIFLINPKAGKRDQTGRIYAMAESLRRRHGLDCACMLTDRPGGGAEMARKLAETGEALRLYACGGDGTVHEAANGLAGFPNAAMTCIPAGTGNDFLRNFGAAMPAFQDAANLWDGDVFPLDLIECNGRLCVTIACCGVDARVAEGVHRFSGAPLLSGRGSYLCSVAVNVLFRDLSRRWTVTIDGEAEEGDFTLAAVCNGRHYGGGSTPVPQARMDDGTLHAILVRQVGRTAFARLFPAYSAGDFYKFPHLARVVTAGEVRIRGEDGPLTVCLDGECFRAPEAVLRLSEKKLNFFGPKGCDPNATAR